MARLRKSFLRLTLLLGLVLAAGLLWREAVFDTAVRLALSSRGLGDARFEVVAVGRTETVIENFSLGTDVLSAQKIWLTYDPADLVSGRLRDLRIEGLRFDPQHTRPETLTRLKDLALSGGGPSIELPRIVLENAEIVLAAPVGGAIAIDGELDLSGEGLGVALEIGLDMGHTTAGLTVRSEDLGEGGVVEISGGGETELVGLLFPGPMSAAATGGGARYTVEGTAQIPTLDAAWPEMWRAAVLSLKGDLRLSGVTTSIGPGVLSADIGWELRGDNGSLQIDLLRPAQLVVQGIAPEIQAALHLLDVDGVAPDLSVALSASGPVLAWSPEGDGGIAEIAGDIAVEFGGATAGIRATATAGFDASWRLSTPASVALHVGATAFAFSGAEGGALLREAEWDAAGSLTPDGEVDLQGSLGAEVRDVNFAGFKADTAGIDGNVRVRQMAGRWSLAVAPGLTISMEGVAVADRLEIGEPVLLTTDRLDVSGGDADARIEMSAWSSEVTGVLLGSEGQEVAFADAGSRMTLSLGLGERSEGEIRLEDTQLTLPGEAISLNAISARLPLGPPRGAAGEAAELTLSGEVHDRGRVARFSPFKIDLEGERNGELISVSGALETLNRAVRLPVTGSADVVEMTGKMNVGPTRLTFRKGGLQPSALSPKLVALRDVAGAVRINAEFDVAADGALRAGAELSFDDLSTRTGDVEVAGLTGAVRLSQLSPLATAGPQQLRTRRLIAGVPVDRPRAQFTILPRRSGVSVRIHNAVGEIAGGEVAVEDVRWDSTAKTNAFDVRVRDVEIDRLLRDWQVEGISGTGRISGVIPVRIGPTGLTVADGRLDSAGAGAIRVDWGSARETLVNSGEQVALTVNALEDFGYDSLSIKVDQPDAGALTLAIGLEGANPAVLEGYPFRFNINLSGELAPILEAVREGRRIGADLLHGGFGSSQ